MQNLKPMQKKKVSLPLVSGPIAVNADSYPFGAANRQTVPVDLSSYGYVEEEYFISGPADVYAWNKTGIYPKIKAEGGHYTTRILVRRPADMAQFSGNAVVELMNWAPPCEKAVAGWGMSGEYMMRSHDVWVGVTVRAKTMERLQHFDAKRYAALGLPNPVPQELRGPNSDSYEPTDPNTENGMIWDMLGQLAGLLKSSSESNPLHENPARYVFATGATGGDLSTYVAAIHPFAVTEDGSPVYDGYLIYMTGLPGNINQEEFKLEPTDDRCKLFIDVPLIRVMTMADILGGGLHPDWSYVQRRPDSDLPGRQYRLYEVAGAAIGSTYDRRTIACDDDVRKVGGKPDSNPFTPGSDTSFPTRYIMRAALDNLKRWSAEGIPPPRAKRIALEGEFPDAVFRFDRFGNPIGGVRTPYVDVPLSTYCENGTVIPFSSELIHQLYPTWEAYVAHVVQSTAALIDNRWILPADGAEIVKQAKSMAHLWKQNGREATE